MQRCLNTSEIWLIGDSRTRVLYRALSAKFKGDNTVQDEMNHGRIVDGPMRYFWSTTFEQTFQILNKSLDILPEFLFIGEQFLHTIYAVIWRNRKSVAKLFPNLVKVDQNSVSREGVKAYMDLNQAVFV